MSIEIEKINKSYDNQQVLYDISFSMKKGEIVGFLGPNGAGKSTLMRIITCFISQGSGVVKVCNIDNQENDNQETKLFDLEKDELPENIKSQLINDEVVPNRVR